MAKSRRANRRNSRKSGGRRMSGTKKLGLFRRIYSPVNHLIQAAENSVNAVARGTSGIVRTGLGAVNNVGKSVTSHADQAVRNIVSRRKSRKHGGGKRRGRKGRKGSRKHRKGSRKH